MKKLNVYSVDVIDHLVQPDEFDDITPESSALTILTDFKAHRPHVVEAHIPAAEAAERMLQESVTFKLVVDRHNEFIGVVSIDDLSGQSILLTQITSGLARAEVLVSDLMHSRESIRAINYDEFKHSSVADIIYTMQRHGQEYYIVVDRDQHHIRGVVSSAEISRRLHSPVFVERRPSVADMLSLARG